MKYNLFILFPNLTAEEIKGVQAQIDEIIKKIGGQVEEMEEMGRRKLSYMIKGVRYGFYVNYVLNLPLERKRDLPAAINELKEELKLNQGILRFELSKTKPRKSAPALQSATAQKPRKKETEKISEDKDKTKEAKEPLKISLGELNKKLDDVLKNPADV